MEYIQFQIVHLAVGFYQRRKRLSLDHRKSFLVDLISDAYGGPLHVHTLLDLVYFHFMSILRAYHNVLREDRIKGLRLPASHLGHAQLSLYAHFGQAHDGHPRGLNPLFYSIYPRHLEPVGYKYCPTLCLWIKE